MRPMVGHRLTESSVGGDDMGYQAPRERQVEAVVDRVFELEGEPHRFGRSGSKVTLATGALVSSVSRYTASGAVSSPRIVWRYTALPASSSHSEGRRQILLQKYLGRVASQLLQHPLQCDRGVDDDGHRESRSSRTADAPLIRPAVAARRRPARLRTRCGRSSGALRGSGGARPRAAAAGGGTFL